VFDYLDFDCLFFVGVFMIWYVLSCCLFVVYVFGFLVAAGVLLFCRNNTSFPSIPTHHFWPTKNIEGYISADWIPRVPNQPSSKCKKYTANNL